MSSTLLPKPIGWIKPSSFPVARHDDSNFKR